MELINKLDGQSSQLDSLLQQNQKLAESVDELKDVSENSEIALIELLKRAFSQNFETIAELSGGVFDKKGYIVDNSFSVDLKVKASLPAKFQEIGTNSLPISELYAKEGKKAKDPILVKDTQMPLDLEVDAGKKGVLYLKIDPPEKDSTFVLRFNGIVEIKGKPVEIELESDPIEIVRGSVKKAKMKKAFVIAFNLAKKYGGKFLP